MKILFTQRMRALLVATIADKAVIRSDRHVYDCCRDITHWLHSIERTDKLLVWPFVNDMQTQMLERRRGLHLDQKLFAALFKYNLRNPLTHAQCLEMKERVAFKLAMIVHYHRAIESGEIGFWHLQDMKCPVHGEGLSANKVQALCKFDHSQPYDRGYTLRDFDGNEVARPWTVPQCECELSPRYDTKVHRPLPIDWSGV